MGREGGASRPLRTALFSPEAQTSPICKHALLTGELQQSALSWVLGPAAAPLGQGRAPCGAESGRARRKGAQNECFPIWVSLSGVSPPHSRTHACTHTRTRMHTRAPAPILTPQCPQRRPNAEGRFLAARP